MVHFSDGNVLNIQTGWFVALKHIFSYIWVVWWVFVNLQRRDGELEVLKLTSKDLRDSEAISSGIVERIQLTCDQWDAIKSTVKQRIQIANDFIAFHQSADKVHSNCSFLCIFVFCFIANCMFTHTAVKYRSVCHKFVSCFSFSSFYTVWACMSMYMITW